MDLERELKKRLETKSILLMTHLMLGYPSLAVNREVIAQMAANGVDCIELQIPFSEPIADGPVILRAGQRSLEQGMSVEECFRFGQEMAAALGVDRDLSRRTERGDHEVGDRLADALHVDVARIADRRAIGRKDLHVARGERIGHRDVEQHRHHACAGHTAPPEERHGDCLARTDRA